jgi:hypothetical protein
MIGRTTTVVASGLLLACLLAASEGALRRGGDRPLRLGGHSLDSASARGGNRAEPPPRPLMRSASDDSSMPSPGFFPPLSPGVEGVHEVRKTLFFQPMQRSTSHSQRLGYIGDNHIVHAARGDSVYEAVQQRGRRWSPEPVTSPPPLLSDRPHGEHTYIKTKLYPHVSF